jgi:hypothetical protein
MLHQMLTLVLKRIYGRIYFPTVDNARGCLAIVVSKLQFACDVVTALIEINNGEGSTPGNELATNIKSLCRGL